MLKQRFLLRHPPPPTPPHRFAGGEEKKTLMVRSAATPRVSNHEATMDDHESA
jgi:hypothetical protein